MKKILMSLFVLGLFAFSFQAHASFLSDALLKIESLTKELTQLKLQLKASVGDVVLAGTSTGDITPRIMFWPGAVNQHVDSDGVWRTDSDGKSGGWPSTKYPNDYGGREVEYCNKFYSDITSVEAYKNETINTWYNAGNIKTSTGTRMSYKCVEGDGTVPVPLITVLSPNGGEEYKAGDKITVKWNSEDMSVTEDLSIEILKPGNVNNGGGWVTLLDSTLNDGSQIITLGSDFTAGDYKIAVKSDRTNDMSDDYFTIDPVVITTPKITVLSISKNESIKIKEGVESDNIIKFNVSHNQSEKININSFKINFEYVGGDSSRLDNYIEDVRVYTAMVRASLLDVADFTKEKTGLYSKTVSIPADRNVVFPNGNRDFYVTVTTKDSIPNDSNLWNIYINNIRYTLSSGFVSVDNSVVKNNFSVISSASTTPSTTIISPNGGETYEAGKFVTVKWSSSNIPATQEMTIQFGPLYLATKNTGSYTFTIPNNLPGNYYKVIVNMGKEGMGEDSSDGDILVRNNISGCFGSSSSLSVYVDPASPNSDILLGGTNVELARYKLIVSEKCSLSLNNLTFVDYGGTNAIKNIKLYDESGVLLSVATKTPQSSNSFDFKLNSPLVINKGQTEKLIIKSDIELSYLNTRFQAGLMPGIWGREIIGVKDNESGVSLSDYNISIRQYLGPVRKLISGNYTQSVTVVSPNGGEKIDMLKPLSVVLNTNNAYPARHNFSLINYTNPSEGSLDYILGLDSVTFTQDQIKNSQKQEISFPIQDWRSTWKINTTDKYKIKVCVLSVCDESDNYFNFALGTSTTPSITVLSPNGGESYKAGDKITVKWKTENIPGKTNISVAISPKPEIGKNFFDVVSSNDGVEVFTIPANWSGKYEAFVRSGDFEGYGTIGDFSDNTFTITSTTATPSITVLSPNGGETYKTGDQITVKWSSVNVPTTNKVIMTLANINTGVIIYLTDDKNIPAIYSLNDGIETFNIPTSDYSGIETGSYKFSISALASDGKTGVRDESNTFTIISSTTENGCFNGEVYSSTTGQLCGCSHGEVYSSTTGQKCPTDSTVPVISGISGPQTLDVNQKGTWKVTASSSTGGNLSYSVKWGDEVYLLSATSTSQSSISTQQSATFTHTYSQAGTYTPTFTVTSENTIRCITTPCPSNGGSATTSMSVKVGNSSDAYVNLVYPKSGETFKAGQNVEIKIDSNLTRLGAFRALIYRKDSNNQYIFVKKFDTANSGIQTLQIPFNTSSGEYKIDYGHIFSDNDYTQYGTATFYVTSDSNGCSNGEVYSSTTGQICPQYTTSTTSSPTPIGRTLKVGVKGEDVVVLQKLLGITEDGSFGPATKAKVMEWQVANGLTPDGVFGNMSRQKAGL